MIKNFDDAFSAICGEEGKYVDNLADPGGATMYGITERVARAHGYTGDMHALPLTLAKTIAKTDYWDKFQCDQFDPRIGYLVFDAAFNGGHPAQWLQAAAQVTQDGVVGTGTVAAVRGTDPWRIMARFNASHAEYYASLRNFTFIDGWVNRIAFNLRLGAENG